jgi:hypothetical protein
LVAAEAWPAVNGRTAAARAMAAMRRVLVMFMGALSEPHGMNMTPQNVGLMNNAAKFTGSG